jgi:hypothetical protein
VGIDRLFYWSAFEATQARLCIPGILRNDGSMLTCVGMKCLLMGDGDRWKSVSPCAQS